MTAKLGSEGLLSGVSILWIISTEYLSESGEICIYLYESAGLVTLAYIPVLGCLASLCAQS